MFYLRFEKNIWLIFVKYPCAQIPLSRVRQQYHDIFSRIFGDDEKPANLAKGENELRVHYLDVGQGDAILITDGASSALVDTGPDGAVVEALARNNVFHLDVVVLTHLHADHAGGLEDVLGVASVGMVVVPEGTDTASIADGARFDERS